jgi:hypothetical protein
MWRCAVLTLAFAGCTNPDDILVAHGSVGSVDSVDGQVVRLLRYLNPQPSQFQAPPVTDPCALATPLKETSADATGAFGFEVFRVETRRALCFRAEAQFPSGAVAWSDLFFYGPERQLPPLLDWRAAPRLDGGVLHFDPPVPWPDEGATGIQLTHRVQVVTTDGGLAWQAVDRLQLRDTGAGPDGVTQYAREPLVVDALRLEDFEGTLSLSASLFDPDQETPILASEPLPARMRAAERLALRGTRVPLSRGLGCPELATPCPLTDGELTEVDAGMINEVSFNLPAPANVSAVVLRGAWVADEVLRVVLAQDDGGIAGVFERAVPRGDPAAFPLGGPFPSAPYVRIQDGGYAELRLTYLIIPLDAGVPTSRVTLQFPAGLARIKEVSIFEP